MTGHNSEEVRYPNKRQHAASPGAESDVSEYGPYTPTNTGSASAPSRTQAVPPAGPGPSRKGKKLVDGRTYFGRHYGYTSTRAVRAPGPSTPRVQAIRAAAAAYHFEDETEDAVMRALYWCDQSASERQEQAVFQVEALEAEIRAVKNGFQRDALTRQLIKPLLNPEDYGRQQTTDPQLPHGMAARARLAQLVFEQLALPCSHPDLLQWEVGTRVFQEDVVPRAPLKPQPPRVPQTPAPAPAPAHAPVAKGEAEGSADGEEDEEVRAEVEVEDGGFSDGHEGSG